MNEERANDEREWVEDLAVKSRGRTAATGEPGFFAVGAGDRRADRLDGRGLHPADGTHGDAAVSGGRRSLAAFVVSGRRVARHRLLAVSLFSLCAGQRRAANESGFVRARRAYNAAHRAGQVFLHVGNAGQRHPAGTRRAFGASGRWHCFGAGTASRLALRASQELDPGGSGGGHCRRV